MSEFTKDPWRLKEGISGAPIIETAKRPIAKVLYHGGSEDPEVIPNSKLLLAAPDMYEALESIHEYWNRDENEKDMADALWYIVETAFTALQKARGEVATG